MALPEVKYLLDAYTSLKYIEVKHDKKIICNIIKHEMPATVIAVESYVKGKKFKNALRKQMHNYEQYKPHIIPSTKKKHLHELFCTLTLRHISKTPEDVERHVKGKRFQRALARWQSCQKTGEKFVPRRGGQGPGRTNDDSYIEDGHFWSDESNDDRMIDNDDMNDLYPAADFSGRKGETKGKKHAHKKNVPPAAIETTASSDSDYDIGVLDSKCLWNLN